MFTNGLDVAKMAMRNVNSGNTIINVLGGRGGADMMHSMTNLPPLFDFAGGRGGCGDSFELCDAGHGPRRGGHCCEAEYGNSKKGKYDGIANIIDAAGGAIAKIFNPLGMLGGLFGGGLFGR